MIVRGKLPARLGDVCANRVSNNDVMCKDKSVIRMAAPTVSISLALWLSEPSRQPLCFLLER